MKRRILATIVALTVLATFLSAVWIAPMISSAFNGRAPPSGNTPTITKFQVDIQMFCYPLNLGNEPKNGQVSLFWQFTVEADISATAGLELVRLSFETDTHNETGVHTGTTGWTVYLARPSPLTTDQGFGSQAFSTHPREGSASHPHYVWVKLSATDSTGTAVDVLRLDLPNCYEN